MEIDRMIGDIPWRNQIYLSLHLWRFNWILRLIDHLKTTHTNTHTLTHTHTYPLWIKIAAHEQRSESIRQGSCQTVWEESSHWMADQRQPADSFHFQSELNGFCFIFFLLLSIALSAAHNLLPIIAILSICSVLSVSRRRRNASDKMDTCPACGKRCQIIQWNVLHHLHKVIERFVSEIELVGGDDLGERVAHLRLHWDRLPFTDRASPI